MLVLFSCEQEELDNFVNADVSQAQTRSASSIADFSPIAELGDIPVHILNSGNTKNKYLTCAAKGTKISLTSKDDGSLRQRWYFKNGGSIISAGGNNGITSDKYGVVLANNSSFPFFDKDKGKPDFPCLTYWEKSFFDGMLVGPAFGFSYLSNGCCMIYTLYGDIPNVMIYYLQSESSTSTSLKFKTNNSSNLVQWEITPIGEYELVDLEYVRTTVDNIAPTEVVCAYDEYSNKTSSTNTWHYSITASCTETSTFSKT